MNGEAQHWWHLVPWRGSDAEARADTALARAIATAPHEDLATGPHPLLRIFNPRCAHDRCAITIMTCPECKVWTDAHWADKIPLGAAGG